MGLFFTAVLLASVALVSGSSTLGVVTALDPGRITSWRLQWPSLPVELSYTNAQEQDVVVMLRLNVPHSISQGVVEVVFPQGFDVSTAFCMETNCQKQPTIQGQTVILLGVTLDAGKDYTVTLGGVGNPPAQGGYGPFGVRTRACAGCQTLDINLSFASIGITGSVGTMKTIALSTPAGVPIIRSTGLTLDFSFVISKDLWRHDTVRITLSRYWTLDNPICVSKLTAGRTVNKFVSSSSGSPSAFGCSVTSKSTSPDGAQVLYVYGLGSDLELSKNEDSKYVVLSITGFTAPYYDYPDDFYSWRVETMRCTTRNVLEKGNILSGPSVNPFPIQPATWKSTWSYPSTSLMKGMQLYMDLSFTLPYEVPFGGFIQITTTGATVNTFWGGVNCYLKERYAGTDPTRPWVSNTAGCAGNGAYSVLISNLPALPAGKPFTVRSLVSIQAATMAVTAITSYTQEGYGINTGNNLATLTANDKDYLLSLFEIVMTTAGGTLSDSDVNWTGGTADYSYYLKFRINPATDEIIATSQLNITCPFASSLDDFRMYIPNDANTAFQARQNLDMAIASDFTKTLTTTLTRPTINYASAAESTVKQDYFLLGPSTDLVTLTNQLLVIGISRSTSGPGLGWPRVASNAATAYECYITITDTAKTPTTAQKTQRGVAQFTISPREWTAATAKYFCSRNYPGAPIYVSVQPSLFPVLYTSPTSQFFVEFEFTETMSESGTFYPRFSSGLDDNSEYPYDLDDPLTSYKPGLEQSLSFQIYSESLRTKLRITNFDTLQTTQSYAIVFPIGEQLNQGTAKVTMRSYYVQTADDRVKNVQHESVANLEADLTASPNVMSKTEWVFGDYVLNGEVLGKNARLKLRTDVNAASQGSNWLFFLLPQGYTLVNPSVKEGNWDIWSAVNSFTQMHYFVSQNMNFKFPSILVKCTISACVNSLADRFVEISGIKPSLGVPCNYKDSIRVVVTDKSDRSGACLNSATIEHTTLAGNLTIAEFQPQKVQARGPNSVDFSAKVVFRTQHGGYSDSVITLAISEEFECIPDVTSCEVEGLFDYNSTTRVRCVMIGNEVVIDNFADFTAAPAALITLQVYHLNPPLRDWVDSIHFITTFRSRTRDGRRIDNWGTTDVDLVTVTPAEPQGHSSILQLETVPLNGGQRVVDLHIAFSLPHEVPALAGKIEITSPIALQYSSGNLQNQCWVSGLLYTSCIVANQAVTLTFKQRYAPGTPIEIYLDKALGPLAGNKYIGASFGITSYWGSAIIDRDLQPDLQGFVNVAELSHRLKPLPPPAGQITSASFSFNPTTAGEVSWYTFTMKLSSSLLATDQIWVLFPQDAFDAYVGPAEAIYTFEPTIYYIPCTSPNLGSLKCTADHWVVRVFPGNSIEPLRSITFSIRVFNPPHHLGYPLDLAHTNAEGEIKAIIRGAAVVTPKAPAGNIVVKKVETSSVNVWEDTECRLEVYLSQTMNTTSLLQVKFPSEFDLYSGSLPCNSTFLDQSPGATITIAQDWNPATSCSINAADLISFPAPSVSTPFDLSKLITLRVNTRNPEWGKKRIGDLMWDFDKRNTVSQPSYDVWTDRWELFVYDTATQAYTSRAYPNLHCGYTGLFTPKKALTVNLFDPALDINRIKVGAGLSTDSIVVQAPGPCASKSVKLSAKVAAFSPDRGFLSLTSSKDFTLYQTESSLSFRVAAAKRLTPGIYTVEWSAAESTQPGVSSPLYYQPVKTTVEVFTPKDNSVPISFTHTESVAVGARSVPIRIVLSSPPATQLIVNIEFGMKYRGVTIHPEMIVLEAGQNSGYFELILEKDFDVGTVDQVVLTFWLGGENANLYQIPQMQAVDVTGIQATPVAPTVLSWNILGCSRTSCSLSPQFSSPGVFYWQLAASGTASLSLIELKSKIDRLSDRVYIENEDTFHNANYLNDFRVASQTDPDSNELWEAFQRRLYRSHLSTSYYGRGIQYNNSTSLNFDWLWAQTNYTLKGYYVDMFEAESAELKTDLNTGNLADAGEISLTLTSNTSSPVSIINAMASQLGVNPQRLFYNAIDFYTLKQSPIIVSVVADRFVERQDPALGNLAAADLNAALSGLGQPTIMSMSYTARTTRQNLTLTEPLNVVASNITWVQLTFNASGAGELCCIGQPVNSTQPSAQQAWLGLSAANDYLPRGCGVAKVDRSSVWIRGLLPATQYQFVCALGDNYPLWRTLSQGSWGVAYTTPAQMPVRPQKAQFIPQAGGAVIVIDVNSGEFLSGFVVLAFLSLFAH